MCVCEAFDCECVYTQLSLWISPHTSSERVFLLPAWESEPCSSSATLPGDGRRIWAAPLHCTCVWILLRLGCVFVCRLSFSIPAEPSRGHSQDKLGYVCMCVCTWGLLCPRWRMVGGRWRRGEGVPGRRSAGGQMQTPPPPPPPAASCHRDCGVELLLLWGDCLLHRGGAPPLPLLVLVCTEWRRRRQVFV